jgi:hypothetical protein
MLEPLPADSKVSKSRFGGFVPGPSDLHGILPALWCLQDNFARRNHETSSPSISASDSGRARAATANSFEMMRTFAHRDIAR